MQDSGSMKMRNFKNKHDFASAAKVKPTTEIKVEERTKQEKSGR